MISTPSGLKKGEYYVNLKAVFTTHNDTMIFERRTKKTSAVDYTDNLISSDFADSIDKNLTPNPANSTTMERTKGTSHSVLKSHMARQPYSG